MGRSLAFSFLHDLVLAFLVGYVASCSLPRGTSFPLVFRVTAVTALLAFGGAWPVLSTWFAHRWCVTWKHVLDAAIYAALVGAVFAWLWPR
jgi:hypothetical protein